MPMLIEQLDNNETISDEEVALEHFEFCCDITDVEVDFAEADDEGNTQAKAIFADLLTP